MNENVKSVDTRNMVMMAILTAVVVVLQLVAFALTTFGLFSLSLVLVPIVIGAAKCGKKSGAWLGFVFSVVVLLTNSGFFLAINVWGTIITVIAKGVLAGYITGWVYEVLSEKINLNLAVFISSIVCPVVNTGVFLIGCGLFFTGGISADLASQGMQVNNVWSYILFTMVGINFILEFISNIILSPSIVRILNAKNV